MTNSIEETLHNQCIFIIGTNTTENHPVIATMMKRAKENGAKIIVADPRRIEMADYADLYLQIQPGSNIALINAMCHVIIREDLVNKKYIEERTEDFDLLKEFLRDYTPEAMAPIVGVRPEEIEAAARLFATNGPAGIYYAMGITQFKSGTHGVMSLSNLSLMTGNVGIENAGINPLRGQNNVQGACDVGCLPSDLPGYQKVIRPAVIEDFQRHWQRPLSGKVGLTIPEVMNEILEKRLKMLWVFGENPAISDPDSNHVRHALEEVDFLVVNDLFLTETAEFADVVLPACSFAEKDGTFTNSERRVQRVHQVVSKRGESKADWEIFAEILNRLDIPGKYSSAEDVFDEIAKVTPSYRGINYQRIQENGLQWPCPGLDHPGTRFLHEKAISRGRGLFMPVPYVPAADQRDKEFPLILTTGRVLYQYHTMTMTGKTEGLNELTGDSYVEVSPATAKEYNLTNGQIIGLRSRRGSIKTSVRITDIIDEGVLFMPFHFNNGANVLTGNALDQIAKIPEFKVSTVAIDL